MTTIMALMVTMVLLHRGRLNVLCNILKKPPGALYGEMEGGQSEFHVGDVKYHMGQSASLEFPADVSLSVCDDSCDQSEQ